MPKRETSMAPKMANATASDVYQLPYEGGDAATDNSVEAAFEELLASEETPEGAEGQTPEAPQEEEAVAEGEEAEAEAEDSEVEEQESQEEVVSEDPLYSVKVDGEEVEVPLSELLKGYSRTSDYTKKTQALAEVRKATEQEVTAAQQAREEYSSRLQVLEQAINEFSPPEPNWDYLRKNDPAEYAAALVEHQQRQQRLEAIRMEKSRLDQIAQQEQQSQMAAVLEKERAALHEAIPEWAEPERASSEKRALAEYAKGLGYSDQDLDQVYDHRIMLILRKAWQYDQMASKPPVKAPPAKSLQPGARLPSAPAPVKTKTLDAAKKNLARSGTVSDAANVFLEMLTD